HIPCDLGAVRGDDNGCELEGGDDPPDQLRCAYCSTVNEESPRRYGEGLGEGANSVLGKTRLILEAFELDDTDLSLSELSRRTGISKASVHRLSHELLEWGMLERSGAEYRLGMRAFEL